MDADRLIELAQEARGRAYAPYSGLAVGAALLTASGEVVTGCNVENAAFSLTMCAERTALVKAVSEGHREFRAIAVAGPEGGPELTPCGSCRQMLHEFAPEMTVFTTGAGAARPHDLRELLPASFSARHLPETLP